MRQTVFNTQTVFVLDDAWDGESSFQSDISVLRDTSVGLTKRETRRPYSSTLRLSLKFDTTVTGASLRLLQASLRALNTQPVIVPFWPAMMLWGARAGAAIKGGLMVAFKYDWSQFEVYEAGSEPGWPAATDYCAPALQGYIKPTAPEMLSPNTAQWSVDFTESSPANYAVQVAAFAPSAGPQPAGYASAPKLLPVVPDFTKVTEEISVDVKREGIGFTRDQSTTFYPQAAARIQDAEYTLSDAAIANFIRFFQDVMASGSSFWAPGWLAVGKLSAAALATDTVLNLTDAPGCVAGDYLSIFSGGTQIAAKVNSVGANTITLTAMVGAVLGPDLTCILPLVLARLDKPMISVAWESPSQARFGLSITEVPPEYVPTADETLGTTLGQLSQRILLFEFDRDLRNGTVVTTRLTNYETDINDGTHVWTHANVSAGDIKQSLNMENDGMDIVSFLTDSINPMVQDVALQSEAPMTVTLYRADYNGVSVTNIEEIFIGDCAKPSRQGRKITVKCTGGSAVYESQVPRMIRGTVCNHLGGSNDGTFLISAGCTLLKAVWKFTGIVVAPVSAAYPYQINLNTLTAIDVGTAAAITAGTIVLFSDFFALGWIEWGAGADVQRRQIIGSTVPVAGAATLKLHKYFLGAGPQIGDTITFYPGCDGSYTTCKIYDFATNPRGKLNNYPNFGAEPFTPPGNPSLLGAAVSAQVQGGKK